MFFWNDKAFSIHCKQEFTVTINFSYNDADLDYLYDYYNEDAYDDSFSSINGRNGQQSGQGGGTKTISHFPDNNDDRNGQRDGFLVDLPIVNQRENGVEFFPTPSSTDNRRKSTTLTAR